MTADAIITAVSRIAGKDGKPATTNEATNALIDALIDLDNGGDLASLLTAWRRMDSASYRMASSRCEENAWSLEQNAQEFHGLATTIFEEKERESAL